MHADTAIILMANRPAIAQLVEHLTVECCSYQMVPGSIPGGRILISSVVAATAAMIKTQHACMVEVQGRRIEIGCCPSICQLNC